MTEPLHTGPVKFLLSYLLAAGLIASASLQAQNTAIVIKQGSTVNIKGGFTLLKDVDLHCNGQWQSKGGTTLFTGANPTSTGGNGTILLWAVQMAKSQNVALTLNSGLQIASTLDFKRGLI